MAASMKIRVEVEKMTNLARVMGWEVEEELITVTGARIVLERNTEMDQVVESARKEMKDSPDNLKDRTLPGRV